MPGDFWTFLMYCFLGVLPFLATDVRAECTFEKNATHVPHNWQGPPGVALTGKSEFVLDECKNACINACVGFAFQANIPQNCFLYDTSPTAITEITAFHFLRYYSRICPEEPTTSAAPSTNEATTPSAAASDPTTSTEPSTTEESCTMEEESDMAVTSSTSAFVDLEASLSTCKQLCTWVSECLAITYRASTSTCVLHATSVSSSSADDYVFSEKNECNGKDCCLNDDKDNTQGSSPTTYSLDLSNGLQSCRDMCVATTPCVALTFSDNRCSFYNASSLQAENSQGNSYYSKTCTGGSLTLVYTCNRSYTTLLSYLLGVCVTAIHTALFL